jgi:hypothetical protein
MEYLKPRYEHKFDLLMWNVIAHKDAKWSVWNGLKFADYYFVQHKIFRKVKRVKCFGYKPKLHPYYVEFCNKHINKGV